MRRGDGVSIESGSQPLRHGRHARSQADATHGPRARVRRTRMQLHGVDDSTHRELPVVACGSTKTPETRIDYYPSPSSSAAISEKRGQFYPLNTNSGVIDAIIAEWAELTGINNQSKSKPMTSGRVPELLDAMRARMTSAASGPQNRYRPRRSERIAVVVLLLHRFAQVHDLARSFFSPYPDGRQLIAVEAVEDAPRRLGHEIDDGASGHVDVTLQAPDHLLVRQGNARAACRHDRALG